MTDVPNTNGHNTLLDEPDVINMLTQIVDKIDRMEHTISRLEMAIDQTPAMMSMTADTLDEAYASLAEQGINPEAHLKTGLQLLLRLTDPETAMHLDNLLTRAEALTHTLDEVPNMVSVAANTFDDLAISAAQSGVNVEERARLSLQFIERLTAPQTMKVLGKLLDNIDALENILDNGPGLISMTADTFDEFYAYARTQGYDLESMARESFQATARLVELLQSEEFQALRDSGMLDPKTLKVLGSAAEALASSPQNIERVGPFSALRSLTDPDVQKVLGFITNFVKRFGAKLDTIDR